MGMAPISPRCMPLGEWRLNQQNQQLAFSVRVQRRPATGLIGFGAEFDPHRPYQTSANQDTFIRLEESCSNLQPEIDRELTFKTQ